MFNFSFTSLNMGEFIKVNLNTYKVLYNHPRRKLFNPHIVFLFGAGVAQLAERPAVKGA